MSIGTVRLHRALRASPERVARAFLDVEATAEWPPPHGLTCAVDHLDARVGGGFRMAFTQFGGGQRHACGDTCLEPLPHERISSDRTDDPDLPGEIEVTVSPAPVACGTAPDIAQQGLPEAIAVERCHLGWQASLAPPAPLVKPAIPG